MANPLFDPRRRQSNQLAFEADQALGAGRIDAAYDLYRQAAALELKVAEATPADLPRVRGLLAVSAASLLLKSEDYSGSKKVAHAFLSTPETLPDAFVVQLEDILELAVAP